MLTELPYAYLQGGEYSREDSKNGSTSVDFAVSARANFRFRTRFYGNTYTSV